MSQIKDYEKQLEDLIGPAISNIAELINTDNNLTSEQDQIDTYYKIQDYLADKWKKEKRDRLMKKKLAKVDSTVEGYLNDPYYKDNGCIAFTTWEEASKANELLKSKGFETDNFCDEGYEQVKYWRPGNEPKPESIC